MLLPSVVRVDAVTLEVTDRSLLPDLLSAELSTLTLLSPAVPGA